MVIAHAFRCHGFLWQGLCNRVRVSKMIRGMVPLPSDANAALHVVPPLAIRALAAMESETVRNGARHESPRPQLPARVWPWLRHLPPDYAMGKLIAQPATIPMFCGLRMIDELGHVNNARYLEIFEFARWHHLSFLGLATLTVRLGVAYVVSDLSITYQREIGPRKDVWVRTRILLPPKTSSKTSSVTATVPPPTEIKRMFVEHEIWSKDGQKLHATATLAMAIIGPVEYGQELQRRFGTGDSTLPSTATPTAATATTDKAKDSNPKKARKRVTLDSELVLADIAGVSSVEELRRLFDSVDRVGTPMPDAAAADGQKDEENVERVSRMISLSNIWRTTRNRYRSKTLVPPRTIAPAAAAAAPLPCPVISGGAALKT